MSRYFTILVLFVFALGTWAQNSPPHQHTQPDMIDGSVHPELIPDSVAWRLYLLAVSENSSPLPNETRRQHSHLAKARLVESDIQAAIPILAYFKVQYTAMIASYNQSPDVLNNTNDGLPLLLVKRDALVQATRDALKATLSPKGMNNLEANIQKEKATMRVAAKEAQQ